MLCKYASSKQDPRTEVKPGSTPFISFKHWVSDLKHRHLYSTVLIQIPSMAWASLTPDFTQHLFDILLPMYVMRIAFRQTAELQCEELLPLLFACIVCCSKRIITVLNIVGGEVCPGVVLCLGFCLGESIFIFLRGGSEIFLTNSYTEGIT